MTELAVPIVIAIAIDSTNPARLYAGTIVNESDAFVAKIIDREFSGLQRESDRALVAAVSRSSREQQPSRFRSKCDYVDQTDIALSALDATDVVWVKV